MEHRLHLALILFPPLAYGFKYILHFLLQVAEKAQDFFSGFVGIYAGALKQIREDGVLTLQERNEVLDQQEHREDCPRYKRDFCASRV